MKGLSLEESVALLRGAARDYERPSDEFIEPRGQLVWAVVDHPAEELVPVVSETLGRLATQHDRTGALRLLANIGTREAKQAILELSLRHRHDEVQPGIVVLTARHLRGPSPTALARPTERSAHTPVDRLRCVCVRLG